MSSRALISWGIILQMGNFQDKTGEKEAVLLGEAAFIRSLQSRAFFDPDNTLLMSFYIRNTLYNMKSVLEIY